MFLLVKSPVQDQQSTRMVNQQPLLVSNPILQHRPSMYCTNYIHTNGTNTAWQSDRTRVTSLPSNLYYEICNKIDAGAHGKNWRDLAGWFRFTADQVQLFEREKYPTDAIIRSWSTKAANNIEKFIGILKENEMTYLVDKIEKKRALIV